jgi:16S rRNA G527 N7-methylase RsmG
VVAIKLLHDAARVKRVIVSTYQSPSGMGVSGSAELIESSQKKSVFLREAMNQLGISKRATIIARPFEEAAVSVTNYVTCRALDEFMNKVPALLAWAAWEAGAGAAAVAAAASSGEAVAREDVGAAAAFAIPTCPALSSTRCSIRYACAAEATTSSRSSAR